jgi:hypothetical protein
MRLLGILLLVLVAAIVLAFRFFPWWAVLGAIALAGVAAYLLSGRILAALFKIPFRAKGSVLRGATAVVHSLSVKDPGSQQAAVLWLLDVTIQPAPPSGGAFGLWEPGELRLVSLDAKAEDTDADGEGCEIQHLEIETEGTFVPDEGMKFEGPQRLRLTFSAVAGTAYQFRYYFELFGGVALPPAASALAQESSLPDARRA